MLKTSKHINKIIKILFIFIFLIIAFVFVLANGISIKDFKLINIEISELYLKLDKKLILNINKVYIKKANSNEALDINQIRKKILSLKEYKQVFLFFQSINIKNIQINDALVKIYYDENQLNIQSDDIEANIKINLYSNELLANITNLKYKNLYFYGDIKIAKDVEIKGYLHSINNDLNAKINIINTKNDFLLGVDNLEIKNQQEAFKHIENYLKPILKEWLITRVKFDNFKGSFIVKIKNNQLENTLGEGVFTNVIANYNDKAPNAYAKEVKLSLKDYSLKLLANNLNSQDNITTIDEFNLTIDNLLKPNIDINIISNNTLYNSEIEKILNAYNVVLGLKQNSGKTSTLVNIKLNNDHTHNVKVDVKTNGNYSFSNFNFNANLNISVNDNLVAIQGNADTKELKISNADINLDTKTKLASVNIKTLGIDYKDYFYYSDKAKMNLNLNNKTLDFPALNTTIYFDKNLLIKSDISSIVSYSKQLKKLNFNDGDIELSSKDGAFFVNIFNAKFDFNLYKNNPNNLDNNYKYTQDDFYISIQNNITTINTKSNLINLNSQNNKTTINLNNLIIDANKLNNDENNDSNNNIALNLLNSKIIYKDFLFNFKNLKLNKNPYETSISASFIKGGDLIAQIGKNNFKAYLRELSHQALNEIVNKEVFISGEIDLDAKGNTLSDYEGLINIRNAYLSNTKNYINLIAFIESIPALVTFNKPGFTKKGLGIKFGSIEFRNKNDIINIDKVNILGYNIDCSGQGIINTKSKTADITLNIFTLKNTNKIISNIPIVKEIFIGGKDNKIATQLKISGSLDNLEYKTSLAKDILTSPFILMKNIITLPKNIIDR
ncbi:AsmA-like C-terminal domain-containing protein [Campylobacter sp. RM12640]|uniref:YhdP family protein n=1 Tax=unclassified Campylobacter TaxID=2593542 RepID=UPI003014BF5E|nr:AsmA-like C-terminal domain-containing protein [Campylobacter sp. RM12640]MBZ7989615.1 AsmA-like C-terminal domain-containing protein [Campylobacter sp. RM12635]